MNFRAVFCDIDGTLLDSAHALRPATARKILEIHNAGTPFILVSARSPSGVFPLQKAIGISGSVVCYGGALVMDESGHPVHSLAMDVRRIADLKKRIGNRWPAVAATVYSRDEWFVDDAGDPRVVMEAKITGVVPREIPRMDLAACVPEVHKVFCVGSPEDIVNMEPALADENSDLAVTKSDPRLLEIMHGRATKANAMKYLCGAMRLSTAEVVAFGDNYNDVDMLECAGLGIAMGNAPAEVKDKAKRVTADNDHEGVLAALETLSFGPLAGSIRFERASFHG